MSASWIGLLAGALLSACVPKSRGSARSVQGSQLGNEPRTSAVAGQAEESGAAPIFIP